ncbi:hypothetical protein [Clostridium botulinum]|uniref:hypothetical protein n=1 Tax=Clostridium botulinum TaxID=1491 RepID=UPI0013FED2E4|nr:hypothetical protein [Clostridium botulinum]MBY6916035.1 hypothetical protein [Clostridium botulinum]NFQ40392.1 hypothetical protein [Clostridium botulinum]
MIMIFLVLLGMIEFINLKSKNKIINKFSKKTHEEIEELINICESDIESKKIYNIIAILSICCSFIILLITQSQTVIKNQDIFSTELELNQFVIEKLSDESISISRKSKIFEEYISKATFVSTNKIYNPEKELYSLKINNENDVFSVIKTLMEYKGNLKFSNYNNNLYNNNIIIIYIWCIPVFYYNIERRTSFKIYKIKILKKLLEEKKDIYIDGENNMQTNSNKKSITKKTYSLLQINKTIIIILIFIILFGPILATREPISLLIKLIFNGSESSITYMQYIGSITGGLATLIALYITVKQTREIQEDNKKRQQEYEEIQTSLEAKKYIPLLDIKDNNWDENVLYKINENGYMLVFLRLKNKGEVSCNIYGYKINCTWKNADNQRIDIVNDTVSCKINLVQVISKDDDKMAEFIIRDEKIKNLIYKDKISIYITLYLKSTLNYRYEQTIGLDLRDNHVHENIINISLPKWISDSDKIIEKKLRKS